MSLEQRIIRLEEMISLQQQEMLGVSKELYKQHQQNQELTEHVKLLRKQIKELMGDMGGHIRHVSEETPPPHY